MVTAPI